jgi:hypothetical protein
LQRGFVQKVAAALRGRVMLQRVIRDVLFAFGEEHAVDLALGALAAKLDVLVYFAQAASHCGDRPLQ